MVALGPLQHRLKSGDASGFKEVGMEGSIGHTHSGNMIFLWNSLGILERVLHADILDSAMSRCCGYLSWKSHHVLERHPLYRPKKITVPACLETSLPGTRSTQTYKCYINPRLYPELGETRKSCKQYFLFGRQHGFPPHRFLRVLLLLLPSLVDP
jgi:hypothetical protein